MSTRGKKNMSFRGTDRVHISTLTALPEGATDLGVISASHIFKIRAGFLPLSNFGDTNIPEIEAQIEQEKETIRSLLSTQVIDKQGNAMMGYTVTTISAVLGAKQLLGTDSSVANTFIIMTGRATAVYDPNHDPYTS